jgi:histidyl-tRNA synthetase
MEELGITAGGTPPPPLLILCLDDGLLPSYQRFAAGFRAAGIPAEVYPEKRKLTLQFSYAEKRGIRLVLIQGGEEAARGTVTLKELASRESFEGLSLESAIGKAKELLR